MWSTYTRRLLAIRLIRRYHPLTLQRTYHWTNSRFRIMAVAVKYVYSGKSGLERATPVSIWQEVKMSFGWLFATEHFTNYSRHCQIHQHKRFQCALNIGILCKIFDFIMACRTRIDLMLNIKHVCVILASFSIVFLCTDSQWKFVHHIPWHRHMVCLRCIVWVLLKVPR